MNKVFSFGLGVALMGFAAGCKIPGKEDHSAPETSVDPRATHLAELQKQRKAVEEKILKDSRVYLPDHPQMEIHFHRLDSLSRQIEKLLADGQFQGL